MILITVRSQFAIGNLSFIFSTFLLGITSDIWFISREFYKNSTNISERKPHECISLIWRNMTSSTALAQGRKIERKVSAEDYVHEGDTVPGKC